MVEVGDGPDYATARRVTQELQKISDGEIRLRLDLSALGSGPYYLWVINNRQERRVPCLLGEMWMSPFRRSDANTDGTTDTATPWPCSATSFWSAS